MIPSNPIPPVCNYGSSAVYCTCPSDAQVANGVVPLDSLPAAWWNWLWAKTNESVNCARGAAGALITEINNVLTQAGVCPNPSCTDQLYQAIDRLRQTIGNSITAGAVKSSSCPSEVAIDANGYMSVNCLGNAANLTTSATTVVGAINELKCTYDCCISDINTAVCDLQNCKAPLNHASCDTTYGVGSASDYGHLKISDTFTSCVGSAADGVAASQKALYDAYTCLSSMPVTFATCACCAYIVPDTPGSHSYLYPVLASHFLSCGSFNAMYYMQGICYCTAECHLSTCGLVARSFIQKKGMLCLDTLPACIEIENKWKVCVFATTCCSCPITVFCNYGTEFAIINYGTLSAGNVIYGCMGSNIRCGFLTPAFPLNLILAPSESAMIPIPSSAFVGRPSAIIAL